MDGALSVLSTVIECHHPGLRTRRPIWCLLTLAIQVSTSTSLRPYMHGRHQEEHKGARRRGPITPQGE